MGHGARCASRMTGDYTIQGKFWGVFTEDGLDQEVETKELAQRERRDLKEMGCKVWLCEAEPCELAVMHDHMREGASFSKAKRLVLG